MTCFTICPSLPVPVSWASRSALIPSTVAPLSFLELALHLHTVLAHAALNLGCSALPGDQFKYQPPLESLTDTLPLRSKLISQLLCNQAELSRKETVMKVVIFIL